MGDMDMMDPEQFDLIFIGLMILHHAGAVAMARIAVERGERLEIVHLAGYIVRTQEQQMDQLTIWRDRWLPNAPAMTMDQMQSGMEMMERMGGTNIMDGMDMVTVTDPEAAKMCTTSGSFDLAFIDAMVPRYQSAIMMAQVAVHHATHPEIREFSRTIIDVQTRELELMEIWRDAWSEHTTPSGG